MRTRKEIILEAMDSMLASAQLEASPGITLQKFVSELEWLRDYPRDGEAGKFTAGQIRYIKQVLDSHFKVREVNNEKYYITERLLI
jgi:hypothetical protein